MRMRLHFSKWLHILVHIPEQFSISTITNMKLCSVYWELGVFLWYVASGLLGS